MKPVVRSDFARLALSFQGTTNTTRHPGLSIGGFENPIAGFEISVPGIVFVQAGIASSCKLTLEFHKKLSNAPPASSKATKTLQNNSVFGIEMSKWDQSGM